MTSTKHVTAFAELSVGELLDKITILEIKRAKIVGSPHAEHIAAELAALERARDAAIEITPELTKLVHELRVVNESLWNIEDQIREKERLQTFDAAFIELARRVYRDNDRRGELKALINQQTGSRLVETKQYAKYS